MSPTVPCGRDSVRSLLEWAFHVADSVKWKIMLCLK